MKFKDLLVIPFIFTTSISFSQADSLVVINANWQSQKISHGVKLKAFCFNKSLFNSNQNITILEIKPGRKVRMDLAYNPKALKKTSEFGKEQNALAALNGTFFDIKNGGSVDYIRSNGVVINKNQLGKDGKRGIHQKAAISFTNGRITILEWDRSVNWEDNLAGEDIMVTGPALVKNNQRTLLDSSTFAVTRNPRSAVAIKKKKVLLITVDGRNENAAGMNLFELAHFLKWLKTDEAINLDGGGSSTLWVNSLPGNGVANYPSDNKKWDHDGERKVANVILVRSKSN